MAEGAGIRRAGSVDVERLDLGVLSQWINGYLAVEAAIPRAALAQQDSRLLQLAETLGILRQTGIASELACTVCADDPHTCRVVRTPEGQYRYRCLLNGWIDLSPDDVVLLVFNRRTLLAELATAAGSHLKNIRMFADYRLARLGFVASPSTGRQWFLAYADRLEDENVLSGVIDALARQFPKGPGLIATPSVVPINLPLPANYRLIALNELLFGSANNLVIDHSAAEIRLGPRKKAPGKPGRPSQREITRELWAALNAKPGWPSERKEQAKLILSHWPEDEPDRPEASTIPNQIRDFERELGSAAS